jgi:hypothetical protein
MFTGFMHSDKETGFYRICSSQPSIIEKTRFLGLARVLKETGFLAESTNHNEELSKKPGFWPPVHQSYESYNMTINLKSA